MFISAPYGRFARKGWGLTINSKAAWFLMELPAPMFPMIVFLLAVTGVPFLSVSVPGIFSITGLLVWESHYIYRTFIYSARMRGSKRNFPLLLVVFALVFNLINGYINSYYLFKINGKTPFLLSVNHIAGLILFTAGLTITISSDRIIRNLRSNGETGYFIPDGGLFRFISSPQYLGEILEWTGWAVFCWSLPALAFALFTFANLFPRAVANHKWYKKNFEEYPGNRKIFIPYIL